MADLNELARRRAGTEQATPAGAPAAGDELSAGDRRRLKEAGRAVNRALDRLDELDRA
jgi:hypothetical protein